MKFIPTTYSPAEPPDRKEAIGETSHTIKQKTEDSILLISGTSTESSTSRLSHTIGKTSSTSSPKFSTTNRTSASAPGINPADKKSTSPVLNTTDERSTISRASTPVSKFNEENRTSTVRSVPCRQRCKKPNSMCFQEKCICQLSYVEQPPHGRCLNNCRLFSDDFSLQSRTKCSAKHFVEYTIGEQECRHKCAETLDNLYCVAYQYQRDTCYLIERKQWSVVSWKRSTGCKFYQRNCEPIDDKPCYNCDTNDKRCDNGKCVCAMGYSLVSGTDRCVKECFLSDNAVTLQSHRLCIDSYRTMFANVDLVTCQKKCVELLGVECRAFQIYNEHCYILDQHNLWRTMPWEDWKKCDHYQRNCRGCDESCVAPQYICRHGQCECSYGYSPTTDGKCVKGCNSYNDEFTLQTSTAGMCKKHPGEIYTGKTNKDCKTICLSEPFVCWGYEIVGNTCYTLRLNGKVADATSWRHIPQCQHLTRRCKAYGKGCKKPCKEPNYICDDGECVCNIGYSRTTDNRCIKNCRSFSHEFTLQSRGICASSYVKRYRWYNQAQCRIACIEASFSCGGFEIYDKDCLLIKQEIHPVWAPYTGCEHYARNCDHKSDECGECDGPNFRCQHGKCQCSRGYSLVRKGERCIRECFSYANTFSLQSTSHCVHTYKKRIKSTTEHKCKIYCVGEKTFRCAAFHVYKGNCYLMEWIKELLETWDSHTQCYHYMRDCKSACDLGFSYLPAKNKCAPKCREYGNTFQRQSSNMCYDNKHRKYKDTSKAECEEYCLKSSDVLCDSYELWKGSCYIMPLNKQGFHFGEYEKCSHFQRECLS